MNAQQVALRGAASRYGKLVLINAWPVPGVLILQSDKRESDGGERGRREGGRQGGCRVRRGEK